MLLGYAVLVTVGAFSLGYEIGHRRLVQRIVKEWPVTSGELASIGVNVDNATKKHWAPWYAWGGAGVLLFGLLYLAATSVRG